MCWLLTLCEDVYRGGLVDDRLARLYDAGRPTADQLRGLIEQRQVDELVSLTRRLHERGTLWELRKLAGNPGPGTPLGIAGPTIVPHWADADLLLGAIDPDHGIDAHGGTLLDVKTVVSVRDTAKVGRWLWQVLLYAWLDTADLYRIRRVGLLLGRHGQLVTWPVDELAERLLGRRVTGDHARDAFHDLAGFSMSSEPKNSSSLPRAHATALGSRRHHATVSFARRQGHPWGQTAASICANAAVRRAPLGTPSVGLRPGQRTVVADNRLPWLGGVGVCGLVVFEAAGDVSEQGAHTGP